MSKLVKQYHLDRMILTVDSASYLVEIQLLDRVQPRLHHIFDLPDWVFESRRAIWLMSGNPRSTKDPLPGMKSRSPASSASALQNESSQA